MLDNATLDGLHTLRLPGMARGLAEQREHPDYDNLGFEERLGMLVDRELTERDNRRLERMVKAAHLRVAATVEGIDFRRPRKSSRALEEAHAIIRGVAPHLDGDRYLALDIDAVTPLVRGGAFFL